MPYIIKKVANSDDELYSSNFTIIDDTLNFVNYLDIFQRRKFAIVVTLKSLIWHFDITINEPQWFGVLRLLKYGIINYERNNKKFVPDQNSSLNKRDDDTMKIE